MARKVRAISAGAVYDGFISYSHAADDLLAPRLQSALQRFAKPWWQRRAVRIFRDESSLSANPHLWSSITKALDTSGWFVLLLSPDAAASEWVNQEISYWVTNRDPKKILPVVTDGAFGWASGDITGDAVPDALRGVFPEEPRWVDLRFARDEEQLDLKHPAFNSAIADIASTIRGVPKDELASEEVRQHRRTVRTAWAAGVALLLLSVAAVGAAVFAFNQQNEANRQRDLAQASEERALEGERRAVANEQRALDSEAAVLREAAVREAQRLLALAELIIEDNPEAASLLLLQGLSVAPPDTMQAELQLDLRDALLSNPVLEQIPVASGRHTVAISADGQVVYHGSPSNGAIRAVEASTGIEIWRTPVAWVAPQLELYGPPPMQVLLSPDGGTLVVVTSASAVPGRVLVLDASTGQIEHEVVPGACPSLWVKADGFSMDGRWFSISTGSAQCDDDELPDEDWAVWYDSESWVPAGELREPGGLDERVELAADGKPRVVWYRDESNPGVADGRIRVVNQKSDTTIGTVGGYWPELDRSGATLLYNASGRSGRVSFWGRDADLRRLDLNDMQEARIPFLNEAEVDRKIAFGNITAYRVSPDESMFAVLFERSAVVMSEAGVTSQEFRFGQDAYDLSWSANGSRLVTAHEDRLIVWVIDPDRDRTALINRADDWAVLALELLDRSFTDAECLQFGIVPCPSLDDLRAELG